jgi:succinyl-diaminopimelate desuccinylase
MPPIPGLTSDERDVLSLLQEIELVELLCALIKARSDFPPGDTRAALRVVEEKLDLAGVAGRRFARVPEKPSLLATLPGSGDGAELLYHAHLDTVSADPELWGVNPWKGVVRDGFVHGRGAGDDKGSLAAQVMALVTLARAGVASTRCLSVLAVSDEESGSTEGTKWLHEEGHLKPSALIVGEQTRNQLAIAERVACGIDLVVYGTSGHGAMPWTGENAALKAARALVYLQDHLFPELGRRQHPHLPPSTLSIGAIHGGHRWNIIPDRCKIEMDRRLIPGETREGAVDEVRRHLEAFSRDVEPLRFELRSAGEVADNINTDPSAPFVGLASRCLTDVTGQKRALTGYSLTSDGRWFSRDGIPILIFGPGDPATAHTSHEHVSVAQLLEAARFLILLAVRWLRSDSGDVC